MRTYTDCNVDIEFEIKSADGSLNETILLPKMLVQDIQATVETFKDILDNDAGAGAFNGVVGFALVKGMEYLLTEKNLECLLKKIGDKYGN